MLSIILNGEPRSVRSGSTIADLAADIGLDPKKVAVERNLEIVPRSTLADVLIGDGDRIEIVHFVGGGQADSWTVAGRTFNSRLIVGTGKYKDFAETREAIDASGAAIVTVAIRRTNIGQNPGEPNLLDVLPPEKFTILPNTAGCYTADDAVRTLRLARELLDGHALVKLEVLGDPKSLFPNMPETLKAAETLVKDGFDVMVYCADDPIQAKMLEDIGCVAIMPLASLIGSGMGILNPWNLRLIIDNAKVPVLVDAGVGTASDAAIAMELGCDGVLMNTAIAAAGKPVLMASAMRKAVEAGREAFLAGRMPRKFYTADPSSPTQGLIGS